MASGARPPEVLVILGTRPEAIKLAPVILALRARRGLSARFCSTGQHRELSTRALRDFGLRADDDLSLMRPGQGLNELCARGLERLGRLIRRRRPALVVVQGDTTSALIGALAAFHERVPIAHVEAGLRTLNLASPFPEEANRVLIDQLSDLHFAPTRQAKRNLLAERSAAQGLLLAGNTSIDALRWALKRRHKPGAPLAEALAAAASSEGFALVTLHRRETLGGPLASLCSGLRRLLDARPGFHLIWPVHLNPGVRRAARSLAPHPRARLLPPLGYLDAVAALSRCRFVMTDSGGLQEEAAFLGKPTLVLRRVNDRPEAAAAGVSLLAGVDGAAACRWALKLLDDHGLLKRMARPLPLYGDGRAAERIAAAIARYLVRAPGTRAP